MSKFSFLSENIQRNRHAKTFLANQDNKLKAVILDFSGTICDPHVIAPAIAFVKSFQKVGVDVTMSQAREPMGLRKDLHIKKMLQIPTVMNKWQKVFGRMPNEEDAQNLYLNHFIEIQNNCIRDYCRLIPGTTQIVDQLQKKYQIKIGSTTGFSRLHTDIILEEAKQQGYNPDFSVAGDDIQFDMGFRPAPYMVLQNMMKFGIYDRKTVLKVDDTIGGVQEGLNAGVWTVGLYQNSNYTNVDSMEQWNSFNQNQKDQRIQQSKKILEDKSGAHYIAKDINDLIVIVDDINKRIIKGEQP